MPIAEITIYPIGTGSTSVGDFVANCVKVLDEMGLNYQLTPMGTVFEGSLEEIWEAVARIHEIPFKMGCKRVVTTLKIDDRRDKPSSMRSKVEGVERRLGKKL
ncbi:MTH1187 family thiamine-binding protein [bacterium]|nr:MTH1187 family thiamine-binding protein [bacterium]